VSAERRATYRIQLRPEFGFAQVEAIAGYLSDLGVSHVYLSPCLQARAGSSHGYDVVDFRQANPELGGDAGFVRMCRTLRDHGLGVLLDFVPNHMAVGSENPFWWDVLENGPSSRYAAYFDIEWSHALAEGGLLLPVLGDHYGRVLEAGEIRVERDADRFVVRHHEHTFPVAPRTLPEILDPASGESGSELLAFLSRAFEALPLPTATESASAERRHRDKEVLARLLERLLDEEPAVRGAVDREIERLSGDVDRLDGFLSGQNYRLAWWRIAARELSYRRFFDINALVAVRVEERRVFSDVHRTAFEWLRGGLIDGLRIDHIDGLRDPDGYLRSLEERGDAWVVVEKILAHDEALPESWRTDGTTGYEFLNLASGLFVDPDSEPELTRFYGDFTGEEPEYASILVDAKRLVLENLLGSDLRRLSSLFQDICRSHRRQRDYTSAEIDAALRILVAHLGVYRTYLRPGTQGASKPDEDRLCRAVEAAKAGHRGVAVDLLDFLRDVLLLRVPGNLESEFALRFQQLTGPAMAKGAEDTAFFRFGRLIALNEVGGDPGRFGVSVSEFHDFWSRVPKRFRGGLLATSTHDTKRSEDMRMRLLAITEIPEQWTAAVRRWSEANSSYRGHRVDALSEYMLYQTLVGVWPADADRVVQCAIKSAREAKLHTSWRNSNAAFEEALANFIRRLLDDREFRADFSDFVAPLVRAGRINSLALTLIKLSAPGIPDIYQGTELWDLSMVDPDNRRAVDFERRRALASDLERLDPESALEGMDSGLSKLWLIQRVLGLRKRRPELLSTGADYRGLGNRGRRSAHALAFARGTDCVTVVPRLSIRLGGDWKDTSVVLPEGSWQNELTGEVTQGGEQPMSSLLARFPVALLVRGEARA